MNQRWFYFLTAKALSIYFNVKIPNKENLTKNLIETQRLAEIFYTAFYETQNGKYVK
jgi:hypothetical protein